MNLEQFQETPWKATNELRRITALPLVRLYFAWHGVPWRSGWRIFGLPLIQKHKGSIIDIGEFFHMRNWFGSNPLGVNHRSILATWSADSVIEIGNHVGLSGTSIVAESRITIGDYVRVGANSTIVDTDFHPLEARRDAADLLQIGDRQSVGRAPRGKTESIVIGDHVFIGMNVLVLKGSTIGERSVIGAGSVVAGTIPERVIAAGNPARVLREI